MLSQKTRAVDNIMMLRSKSENFSGNSINPRLGISKIYLLGEMKITNDTGIDILFSAKKTRALLAYLCLCRGERLSRSRLGGMLWDRSTEARARDHLRHALQEINSAGGSWRLERHRSWVRLDTTDCWIDFFENPVRPDLLEDLQDVSPDFDQWLNERRSRYGTDRQEILEQRLSELVDQDAPAASRAEAARELLQFEPTHESALRSLMRALCDMGNGALALRECERVEVVLKRAKARLSEETRSLYQEIQQRAGNLEQTEHDAPGRGKDITGPAHQLLPLVAVIPLRDRHLSSHPARTYVAEGLTEDLIEALSRIPGLCVASRLAVAALGKQDRSPQEIGSALGARYILSGSVRVVENRLRLNVELTDAVGSVVLWSDRFDRIFSDPLEVQDELAASVVRLVAPHFRSAELRRLQIIRPGHRSVHGLLLSAQEMMHSLSPAEFDAAGELFEQAIRREPENAKALAWRASWHVMRIGQGWSPDPTQDMVKAEDFAARATMCDRSEPMALAVQGHIAAYLSKDLDLAFQRFEMALRINPNNSRAWLWNAAAHAWMGEGADAVEKINKAMVLSPYDPLKFAYFGVASMAHLANGDFKRAIELALQCRRQNPGYTTAHKALIFSLVLAGREAEARVPAQQLLRLEPGFTVAGFQRQSPVAIGPLREIYSDALAKAGIPLGG